MESPNQQRGVQLFELGRFEEAKKYLSLEQDAESKYYLAYCHFSLNEIEKAQAIANQLLSETPDDPDIFYLKARIAYQIDNYTEALDFINEAISIFPYNANYFGMKGALIFQKKEFKEALHFVDEGLRIEPQNRYCLNLRAQLLTKLKQKEAASQTVEHLLQNNPEDSNSHASVGWVALENGETEKALHHFKQALQFEPNNQYAREGMSTALKSKNLLYKWYLKYEFWMANKSSKNQWVFIIGIFVAYRLGIKFLSASGMEYLVAPLIIAYLVFALGGWLMESLSNAILNFDSYGKYLLSDDEQKSGWTFLVLFAIGITSITTFYATSKDYFLLLAVTFFCALLPLPRAFLQYSKRSKLFGLSYGSLMLAVGVFGVFIVPNVYTVGLGVFILFIGFTWIGNLVK